MDNETLHLFIDDDFRHIEDFNVDYDYPDSDNDEMNEVRISIETDTEKIAYMEALLLHGDKIDDFVMYADGISQDAFDAMCELKENGYFEPLELSEDTLDEFFASDDIVYLRYLAVWEDYRGKGFGGWLLKNLPRILSRNYGIRPRLIVTSIAPQTITWGENTPSFQPQDENEPSYEAMYNQMEQLFLKCEYKRLGHTNHYVAKQP